LSQIEFTLVAGQGKTQRKPLGFPFWSVPFVWGSDLPVTGVEQISSSQRFLPSLSRIGLE
jgi:hypothetical protein